MQEYDELGECRNWAVSVRAGSCVPALCSPQVLLVSLCHPMGHPRHPKLPVSPQGSCIPPSPLSPPLQPRSCPSCDSRFCSCSSAVVTAKGRFQTRWFPAGQNKVWQIMKLFREDGELRAAALASETLLFRIIAGDAVVAITTLQIHAWVAANLGPCLLCSSSTSK